MRSYSRNSHNASRARALTATVLLLSATAAFATDRSEHNFALTAYANGKGGRELVAGHYEDAGRVLRYQPSFSTFDRSTTSNNRCVFLSVTRQWDAARTACDTAVRDAQQEKVSLPSYQYWARQNQDEYLAVALSNRAVLHWMSGESEAAATDLKRAHELSPQAAFVTRNAHALEYSRTAMALVTVAPTSH